MAQESVLSLIALLLTADLIISVRTASALGDDDRRYEVGDYIPVFANKVHPFLYPCDAYSYFDLPFCPPGSPIINREKSYEELLEGDWFTNTQYDIKFKVNKTEESLCEKHLTKDEVAMFRQAVKNNFEFQMYCNNIPLKGSIGKVEANAWRTANSSLKYHLIRNIGFNLYYIENQLKNMQVLSDFESAVDITEEDVNGTNVNFTYSVFWYQLKIDSVNSLFRKEALFGIKYGWLQAPDHQGSWILSILVWVWMISVWILSVLAVTVPYVKYYMTRYSDGDLEEARGGINMKQIHGDACRCPLYSSLLGAVLGVGTQLLILICTLFVLAFKGILYPCVPELRITYILSIYCLTSVISGYTATSFHCRFTTIGWKECIFQTGVLYLIPVILTVFSVNSLLYFNYGISDLPDFGTELVIFLLWGLATFSLLILGGNFGYSRSKSQSFCTTSRIPIGINSQPPSWYMKTPAQMILGGLLPFMTIFWKMDNIYASLWDQRVCGAFSTVLKAFIVVIILTIIVGMGFTSLQLSKQDYQWWWRSVLRGGSTAIYMFAYGFYFYGGNNAQEFMNLLLFMGYNACMFYAFFLVLATIGFYTSLLVFRHMNRVIQSVQKDE